LFQDRNFLWEVIFETSENAWHSVSQTTVGCDQIPDAVPTA